MNEIDSRLSYCRLTIAGIPILHINIDSIVLREWIFDFVPTIEIKFRATEEFFAGINLQEDDLIELLLGNRPPDVRELPVKSFFKLKSHIIDKQSEYTIHHVVGILACNNLVSPYKFRAFANKNSSSVLSDIFSEMSLKPNILVKSNDSMTWIQSGTNLDFLKHLTNYSYISDDDLLLAYTERSGESYISSIKTIEKDTPMVLRHNPEFFSYDVNPNDMETENKFYPFVNFTYKSITSLHNMTGGYGILNFSYEWDKYKITVDSNIIGSLSQYHQQKSVLKGQANLVIETERVLNAHDRFMASYHLNNKYRMDFSSSAAVVVVSPHEDYRIGKLVNVEFELLKDGEKYYSAGIYGGKYIIGGIVHHHIPSIGYYMYLVLMRGGMEKGLAMNSGDISMYRVE